MSQNAENNNEKQEKTPLETGKYKLLKDRALRINGKVKEIEIINLKITRELNNHSTLNLLIYKSDEMIFDYLGENIEIVATSYDGADYIEGKTVFLGLIQEIDFRKSEIKIIAKSMSVLLDKGKSYKSYQNYLTNETAIFDEIKKKYLEKNSEINLDITLNQSEKEEDNKEESKPFFIQYEESYWEFLKRIASKGRFPIINKDIYENSSEIKIDLLIGYFDLDENSKRGILDLMEMPIEHKLLKNEKASFYKLSFNGLLNPGNYINLNDNEEDYVISKVEISYNKVINSQYLEFEYIAYKKSDFCIKNIINKNLSGKSLIGKVKEIGLDKNLGKVSLDFKFGDQLETMGSAGYSFIKCATSYSGNKTGEFFMPEVEDLVTVYFPNDMENSAYVDGAVREVLDENYHDINKKTIIVGQAEKSTGIILSKIDSHLKIAGNNANTRKDSSVYIKVKENGISIKGDAGNVEITMNENEIVLMNKNSKITMTGDKITLNVGSDSGISVSSDSVIIKSGSSSVGVSSSEVSIKASKYSAK